MRSKMVKRIVFIGGGDYRKDELAEINKVSVRDVPLND